MSEMDNIKKMLNELKSNENTISMILGGLVVVVVGILLYNYFKASPDNSAITDQSANTMEEQTQDNYALEYEEDSEGEKTPKGLPLTHTVAAGENLWKIAEKYYGSGYNWVDIASENNLSNPGVISAGQELTIPKVTAKKLTVAEASTTKGGLSTGTTMTSNSQAISGDTYTVDYGDNLWTIAVRAYGDGYKWPEIYNANTKALHSPDALEIGMTLQLPR